MSKRFIFKTFLFIFVVVLTFLPFYFIRDYFIFGYKIFKPDYSKLKSDNGVVSVLILGKGGEGHTAPDLTDTIINTYFSLNDKKITLLPLPRDIWMPEMRAKLNSAYYWDRQRGNENYELAKSSVYGITGVEPNYIAVIDFSMFKDLVDSLGGIEVDVVNSFTDERFPLPGRENDLCDGDKSYACRYETLYFAAGTQLMDGDMALKFVRSRNSEGDEGTDLAREARQQIVIGAIKNKLISIDILFNFEKLSKVINSLISNLETDIDMDSAFVFIRLFMDSNDDIHTISIPEDYMIVSNNSSKYDFQYVFIPKDGSWNNFITTLSSQIY